MAHNLDDFDAWVATEKKKLRTSRNGILGRMMSFREIGRDSGYFVQGEWHSEGAARVGGVVHWCLAPYSPVNYYVLDVLKANDALKYFSLNKSIKCGRRPFSEVITAVAQSDLERPITQRRVLIPANQEDFVVNSEDLGEVDIVQFLARDKKLAQEYGNFLKYSCGVDQVFFEQVPLGIQVKDDIACGVYIQAFDCAEPGFKSGSRFIL